MITKFHKAILTRFSRLFQRRAYQTHIQMQHTPNLRLKTAKIHKFRPAFNNDFHTHTKSAPQNRTNAHHYTAKLTAHPTNATHPSTPFPPQPSPALIIQQFSDITLNFANRFSSAPMTRQPQKTTAKTDKNALKSV